MQTLKTSQVNQPSTAEFSGIMPIPQKVDDRLALWSLPKALKRLPIGLSGRWAGVNSERQLAQIGGAV